jgi:uncharacterized protein YdeI (YjbR/CyaY-like superfamily)
MKQYKDVAEFLNDADSERRMQIDALRQLIMATIPVTEHIKWNAPSYVYNGEDRVTFNTHGTDIKILIHMGATTKEDKLATPVLSDEADIVNWNSNIRGTISFESMADIRKKKPAFIDVLTRWVEIS